MSPAGNKRKAITLFFLLTVLFTGCQKRITLQRGQTVPTFEERVEIKERERLRRWNVKSITQSYFEYPDGKLASISRRKWYAEYDRNGRKIYEETPSWGGSGYIMVGFKGTFKFNSDSSWSEVLREGMTISIAEDGFANVTEATWLNDNKVIQRVFYKYDKAGICTLKERLDNLTAETITYEFDSLMRKTGEVRTEHGLKTTVACWFYKDSLETLHMICKESGEIYYLQKYEYTSEGITTTSWRFDLASTHTVRYNPDYQPLEMIYSDTQSIERVFDSAHNKRNWSTKYEYGIDGKLELQRVFNFDSTRTPIPSGLTKYSYEFF